MKVIALVTLLLASSVSLAANQSNAPLQMGGTVYAVNGERANTLAKVINVMGDTYRLKFISDSAVGDGWDRASLAVTSGCGTDLCVGQAVFTRGGTRPAALATVVGLSMDKTYVLKFASDDAIGGSWDRNSLAEPFGCVGDICVGQSVYAVNGARAGTSATIVGIAFDLSFLVKFDSDGAIGADWDKASVARTEGCVDDICVEREVVPLSGGRQGTKATVVAIAEDGSFTLKFAADGLIGSGWTRNDLNPAE